MDRRRLWARGTASHPARSTIRRTGPLGVLLLVTNSTQPGCPPQSTCRMLSMISRMVSVPCRDHPHRPAAVAFNAQEPGREGPQGLVQGLLGGRQGLVGIGAPVPLWRHPEGRHGRSLVSDVSRPRDRRGRPASVTIGI
jgi:hypothetical protein